MNSIQSKITETKAALEALAARMVAEAPRVAEGGLSEINHIVGETNEAAGRLETYQSVLNIITILAYDNAVDIEGSVRTELTSHVLRGAGDTWSGRNNDSQRRHFDGIRDATKWVLSNLPTIVPATLAELA